MLGLLVALVVVTLLMFFGLIAFYWEELRSLTIAEAVFWLILGHVAPIIGPICFWSSMHLRRRDRASFDADDEPRYRFLFLSNGRG
jgi:hypothetical protein